MLNYLFLISGILGASLIASGLFLIGYLFLIGNSVIGVFINKAKPIKITFLFYGLIALYGLINLGI
jgi:predicted MFS family arabinose efflux permease